MILDPSQPNSLDWLMARCGVITASEMDNLLTPEFAPRKGEMMRSYLFRKLAERWLGSPLPGFNSIDCDIGSILEDFCLPLFSFETGLDIARVGLVLTDDRRCGCSPDGLIGNDGGAEAKCPRVENHLKHLLAGVVPKEHLVQVHFSLYVTQRKWWKFISYARGTPMLVVHVERDEEIQNKIDEAIQEFIPQLDSAFERLTEINGGPPKRPTFQHVPKPEPQFTPTGDILS